MQTRFFTLEQATELLPRVEEMIARLVALKQELAEKQLEYAQATERASSNGHSVTEKVSAQRQAMDDVAEQIKVQLEAIQQLGCVVKDLDMGLVDFPSLRNGEPVNLCWRLGEPRIAFWHAMDTGFAGRQPL